MNEHNNSGQLTFDLGHNTSFKEADFIVTEANRLAFDHIKSYPAWPGPLTLITGPKKSGKTHLANIWATCAQAVSPSMGDIGKITAQGGVRALVLDDVDQGHFEETALFNLLNQSMRDGRPILMTARLPVHAWPFVTDDVKSRARLAAHFGVLAADDLQLCQMFAKLFSDRQIVVDPKTITYLVSRMERSPAEVFALVDLLDKLALTRGKPISLKMASHALEIRLAEVETKPES